MTKEEAIKYLQQLYPNGGHCWLDEQRIEAVSMAINALQEEHVSIWHDVSEEPKPNMELICVGQYGNPLVLSSNSDSFKSRDISKWAYFNDLLNLSNIQRTVKNGKEPVSEDLEEAAQEYVTKEGYLAGRTIIVWCGLLRLVRNGILHIIQNYLTIFYWQREKRQ